MALFSADASYFYGGSHELGINHEEPFFILLGVICGCLGSLYIQFQKWVNYKKKKYMQKWWVKNDFIYSLGMAFFVINMVFWTRLLTSADKGVINAMIDADMIIANKHLS